MVTPTERDSWLQLSLIIEGLLSEKLEHFLTCFPFSCPKDDLRITIKLFLLVREMAERKRGRKTDRQKDRQTKRE